MRTLAFIPFLLLYILICAYVFVRSSQALPRRKLLRACWMASLGVVGAGFFMGMAFRETMLLGFPIGYWLRTLGVTWIITLPYWAIAAAFWDILRLINKRRRIFPTWIAANYARAKLLALLATIAAVVVIFAVGYYRFANPDITPITIKIDKHAAPTLRIAVASDIHLGDIIGVERLRNYVARINALHPDLILLPGDIIDRSVEPLIRNNMGPELAKLQAPLGVYAVLGNHEGYAGADRSTAFLEKYGVRVLRDEIIPIAGGSIYLGGRIDYSLPRAPLATILANIDPTRPLILMDHQPRELEEPASEGVDLQFSGHTHAGQIWPITWIVPFLYEDSYGYLRKDKFQLYVSSGLGLWGFPARIGSKSEIVDVRVEFTK